MDLSATTLRHLCNRSLRLYECLSGDRRSCGIEEASQVEEVLRLWRHAFSLGDAEAWEARLRWDGLDVARVVGALTGKCDSALADPDPWTRWLVCALNTQPTPIVEPAAGDRHYQVPFPEIWMGFVVAARTELTCNADPLSWMTASAYGELEQHLVRLLAETGCRAVWEDFAKRAWSQRSVAGRGNEGYKKFVSEMQSGGLIRLLSTYPVLARQVSELTATWIEGSAELLEWLANDLPVLESEFNGGRALGRVVDLAPGLSDRHCGGRQVMTITFESGLKVVLKPRPVTLEKAFHQLLQWLAAQGLENVPGAVPVLSRENHGWMLHVDQASFEEKEELQDYYRRAGSLLCLAHVLGASDLHMENIVAGRRGPCLVDCETLLQPQLTAASVPGGESRVSTSCLSTGLVSFPQVSADGSIIDVSGLCGRGGVRGAVRTLVWRDPGTDGMRPEETLSASSQMPNLPLLGGEPYGPHESVEEMNEGFSATWRFLARHSETLVAPDGPLRLFTGLRTRLVLRPSAMYATILMQLRTPKFQRRGVDGGILVDTLNRVFCNSTERPALWDLTGPERQSLEHLDIPRFTAGTDSNRVFADDREVFTDAISTPGLDLVVKRLRRLDEARLGEQLEILDNHLLESGPNLGHRRERSIDSARWIARTLADIVRSDEDLPGWDLDLYKGLAGVALALAAIGRNLGDPQINESALEAFSPVRQAVCRGELDRLAPEGAIGACTGVGGVAFALAWGGVFLENRDLVNDAIRAAKRVDKSMVECDRRLDVEGGAAGAILGLLAVHAVAKDNDLLERCQWCADRLFASQEAALDCGAAWHSTEGQMLAGFAHGASGIATALLRLNQVVPDSRLLHAARDALRFERCRFSAKHGNWWVPGECVGGEGRVFMTAWCHGAPGVALARMEAVGTLSDASLREELEIGLGTTLSAPLGGRHHLCCGTLGRIDILLSGGLRLGRGELLTSALNRVAGLLNGVGPEEVRAARPASIGLFTGWAGIAYELLRVAQPESLPSLLSFDPPRAVAAC